MGVNLQKGQKIDLTKGGSLKQVMVGLGWDEARQSGGFLNGLFGGTPSEFRTGVKCIYKNSKLANEFDTQGEDQLRFDLEEEFSIETALVVCEIYKRNGEWKFNAVASGYQGGLAALVRNYGPDV